jgi:2-phosphosulfolactate phosphatase
VRVFGSFRGMSPGAVDGLDVVVVDVLRATTTIAYAISRGATVLPLADEHEARTRAAAIDGAILAGEHLGKRLDGFDCNNSPTELAAFDLAGKTVVIATTNGTKAVAACASAHRIFAGALTNAPALARFLCTGGELASEDLLGAGAVVAAVIEATRPGGDLWIADGARVACDLFTRAREDLLRALRSSDAAQELIDHGNASDVDTAGAHAAHDAVPLLQGGMFVPATS